MQKAKTDITARSCDDVTMGLQVYVRLYWVGYSTVDPPHWLTTLHVCTSRHVQCTDPRHHWRNHALPRISRLSITVACGHVAVLSSVGGFALAASTLIMERLAIVQAKPDAVRTQYAALSTLCFCAARHMLCHLLHACTCQFGQMYDFQPGRVMHHLPDARQNGIPLALVLVAKLFAIPLLLLPGPHTHLSDSHNDEDDGA